MNKEKALKIAKETGFGLLSFALPLVLLIAIFASLGFIPFKEDGLSMFMLDMRDQYVAYMRYYQSALRSGNSVIYSLGKFFGGDFMSIFMYYLASPFNLLVAFIPSSAIPDFFFWTAIIKMALGSLNFYLLCRFYFKKADILYLIPAVGYALISYNAAYMCNFMYLDVIMMIPLVILGMRFLDEGKVYWLYPLTLFYCLMTSWYLGAISCLFFALYFIYSWIAKSGKISSRIPYLARFVVFSLLGGFMAGAFWITAFLHFDGTKAGLALPQFRWMSITTFFDGLFENNYHSISDLAQNNGYMTMFTGVVTLSLAQLFFFNKKYKWNEKLAFGLLLLLYFLVSLNTRFSALFHGGREPTWYPTRFSFLIGFFICFLAAKQLDAKKDTPLYGFVLPLLSPAVILPLACFVNTSSGKTDTLYTFSLASLLLYYGALVILFLVRILEEKKISIGWVSKGLGYVSSIALIGVASVSSYRGYYAIISRNVAKNVYQSSSYYHQDEELTPVFEKALSFEDAKLYRMEATFNRPGGTNQINNNPLFYGYNGLNHYSSNEKSEVANYAQKLGFHFNGFYECYFGGSTEMANSVFGVKYLIDDGKDSVNDPRFFLSGNSVFKKMDVTSPVEGYSYYENKYALPIGFAVNSSSNTFVSQGESREGHATTYWYDHFEFQNKMLKSMASNIVDSEGKQKDVYKKLEVTSTEYGSGVVHSTHEYGWDYITCSTGKDITIKFTVPSEAYGQNLYVCEKSENDNFRYYIDGSSMSVASYWNKGIKGFKDNASHQHVLKISSYKPCVNSELRPELYYEDSAVLKEYLTEIAKQKLTDTRIDSSFVSYGYSGKFNLTKEKQTFLFTLPYEKDFKIYVDGHEEPVLKRYDIFSAVDLSSYALGEHNISIVYIDQGLIKGIVASSIAFVCLIPALIFYPRIEEKIISKVHNREKKR